MTLAVTNFYLEPGNELSFASKVNNKLMETLSDLHFKKSKANFVKKGWILDINVSPSKRVKYIQIHGPHVARKYLFINYTAIIPYKEIIASNKPAKKYSEHVEQALLKIMEDKAFLKLINKGK